MSEIKVETDSTQGKITNIRNAGANIKLSGVTDTLDTTNINPFTGYAAAIQTLKSAINNYNSIISEDTQAMSNAVTDFKDNDQQISNQINNNSQASMGLY